MPGCPPLGSSPPATRYATATTWPACAPTAYGAWRARKQTRACPAARSAATAVSGRGPHPHYGAGQDQPPLPAVPALTARSRATVAGHDTPRTDGMQGLLSGSRPELGNHICRGSPAVRLDLTAFRVPRSTLPSRQGIKIIPAGLHERGVRPMAALTAAGPSASPGDGGGGHLRLRAVREPAQEPEGAIARGR